MNHFLRLIILSLIFIVLLSCIHQQKPNTCNDLPDTTKTLTKTLNTDSLILQISNQILRSIRDKDFKSLSTFIHPKQGVRFSPYAYVDTTYDIRLTAYAFLQKQTSKESLKWGFYDGSGDPISLTVDKYFSKFVNNTDFLKAEKVSLNKINRTGSTTNNLLQVYRNCQFAEYYFSGLDKKNEGIDWCALRLVFGKYNNQYYLIGIIHDQWTI